MSANFTPVFGGYRQPGAFKFWCQKVLPLVYDDSLSYYELLCKVVDYINNLIHDNSATIDNMDALLTAYNQLQDYVNTYFANLDLTGEVSNKIDEMADDGELLAIIQPTLDAMGQYLVDQSAAQQTYNEQTRADVTTAIANQTAYNAQTRTQVGASINEQNAYNAQTRGMLSAAYNAPIPVTSTEMIPNGDNIVVWIGTTTGNWKNGYWYFVSKSGGSITATIEGGVYQATATELDKSLNIPDVAADAGSVGVRLRQFAPRQSWTSNYRLNPSTGAAESYTGQPTEHAITGFIDCASISDVLGFDYTSGLGEAIACSVFIYDENSTYLGYVYNSAQHGYVSPSGTTSPLASAPAFQKIRFDVNITTYTAEKFPYSYQDIMTVRRIGTDKTLKAINVSADSGAVGSEITKIKQDISELNSEFNDTLKCKYINLLSLIPWVQGSVDPNTGVELVSSTRIKTGYIPVETGDVLKLNVTSGYRYAVDYFDQSKATITTEYLHGQWQSAGQFFVISSGVKYLRILGSTSDNASITPSEGTAITVEQVYAFLPTQSNEWVSGYYADYSNGDIVANASYSYKKIDVSAFVGGTVKGLTASPSNTNAGIAFYDSTDTFIRGVRNPVSARYDFNYSEVIPSNASYMLISIANSHTELWCDPVLPWEYVVKNLGDVIDFVNSSSHAFTEPVITWVDDYYINYSNGVPTADTGYKYCKIPISMFRGGTITGTTAIAPNINPGIVFTDCYDNYISGYRNTTTGQYKTPYSLTVPDNASYMLISLRKASEALWTNPVFPWGIITTVYNALINKADDPTRVIDVDKKLKNARHIKGDSAIPLTLLHFSDLHKDTGALNRIIKDANNMSNDIDDIICTGDMVSNTSEQIVSWWNENVLTCIGNHETASYNAQTGYNWTALSMANRDAYYIAPFEAGWNIVHTSGTSYYYKDYNTQKIRLIVMDAMLYTATPGAEATAQTAWLANLLSDAITNNLHVLIAIHSPHGGAVAEECSFSRYGQGVMPTYTDCNTPQTVIDAVATAITNGLHFIGYIVGHTHQDNIWDAEDNGKQLMYCVTCASTNYKPQWVNSDQDRGAFLDAYNLVTIDTANTLVKIVRGGGADIDDHMRTRKAICFNYSTGEKAGEVL